MGCHKININVNLHLLKLSTLVWYFETRNLIISDLKLKEILDKIETYESIKRDISI